MPSQKWLGTVSMLNLWIVLASLRWPLSNSLLAKLSKQAFYLDVDALRPIYRDRERWHRVQAHGFYYLKHVTWIRVWVSNAAVYIVVGSAITLMYADLTKK